MNNLFEAVWEAHNPEHNHHRHYSVTVGRDLWEHWTLIVRYGRTGQRGRELSYSSPDPEAIRAIIRERLARRRTAPMRIGCAYRQTELTSLPGLEVVVWLPEEVLTGHSSREPN